MKIAIEGDLKYMSGTSNMAELLKVVEFTLNSIDEKADKEKRHGTVKKLGNIEAKLDEHATEDINKAISFKIVMENEAKDIAEHIGKKELRHRPGIASVKIVVEDERLCLNNAKEDNGAVNVKIAIEDVADNVKIVMEDEVQ